MKYLILVLLILLASSCEEFDTKFKILNTSDKVVSYYFSNDSTGRNAREYYSTFYFNTPDGRLYKDFNFINKWAYGVLSTPGDWNIDTFRFKYTVAYIYVIDSVDIGNDTSKLKRDQLIRKYPITMNYMKARNWVLEVR